MDFTNPHLSFSRIQRFEQCPLSFKLHYIDRLPSTAGTELKFGKAIHWVLEQLVGEHALGDKAAPLSIGLALELWQSAWTTAGLAGVGLFAEGEEILRSFVRREGVVDPKTILAVEQEFEIATGRFRIIGAIDRVDRVDETTIRIRDYKTNRVLFTKSEAEESLQLSLYQLAAQWLWPWAKRIELQFDMLRHDVRLRTSRTPEQLETAERYVRAVGERTESATAFPARPNGNCVYCDHRGQCDAYAAALKGKREFIAESLEDLEAVAREREEVARIAKVAYARKGELDGVLKARLSTEEKLQLAGVRYEVQNACTVEYPLESTLRVLEAESGMSRDDLVSQLATIDKDALRKLLKELGAKLPRPRVTLLRAELDARANRSFTPRLFAKEVRP